MMPEAGGMPVNYLIREDGKASVNRVTVFSVISLNLRNVDINDVA